MAYNTSRMHHPVAGNTDRCLTTAGSTPATGCALRCTAGLTWICYTLALLLLAATTAYGQATSGTVVGTVADPSGAVVAHALVKITSLDTGVARTTLTGKNGAYVISNLPLGHYRVEVYASGFEKALQSPVKIEIKSRVRVDFHLRVGSQSTVVKVSGSSSELLQTDTPETGGLISRTELDSLPVLSRNFLALASTLPGTSPGAAKARQTALNGAALTVSGSAAEANNIMIDGVSDNEEFSGAMSVVPPMDAIQEFKVQTSQYSAEFGRASGGVVNIALKSGTNSFHGFAYDYLQNDKFNATPYFSVTKPPLHSNIFGAGLGGPIVRNKLFFFGDYEGIRTNSPFQSLNIVPTAAEQKGNFSAAGYTIYDPETTHTDPNDPSKQIRDPFPNNQIPANRINAITSTLLSAYPAPNYSSPGSAYNYETILGKTLHLNNFDTRIDNNINAKNILTGRISRQSGGLTLQGFLPGHQLDAIGQQSGMNASLGYTHIFNMHLFNEAHLGYNYSHYGNEQVDKVNVMSQFDVPNYANVPESDGFPILAITNLTTASPGRPVKSLPTPFALVENTYQLVDNVTYEKGNHSLKFGGEFQRLQDNRKQGLDGNGEIIFKGEYTSAAVGETLPNGLADALLGLSNEFITQHSSGKVRISTKRAALYVQDYWRAAHNLTLSMGLRWEVDTSWHEHNDRMANFDFSTGKFILPKNIEQSLNASIGSLPSTFAYVPASQVYPKTNWGDFAPRVGLSYGITKSLVARAGFGIFYGIVPGNNYSNAGVIAPFVVNVYNIGTTSTPININDGFPGGGILGAISAPTTPGYYTPHSPHSPYSEKWSGDIQWSPTHSSVLDVGYDGMRSMHNMFLNFANVATPGPGPLAPRQQFSDIGYVLEYIPINTSSFNALEISYRQNMYHGLMLYSAYTLANCKAYSYGLDGGILSDPWNPNYDYGPCDTYRTSNSSTSIVYNTPSVQGLGTAGKLILNHWQVSGILSLESGLPYTVTLSPDILNSGGLPKNRPDIVGNPNPPSGQRSITHWLNTSAFATPTEYTFGDEKKNTLRGPDFNNLDFALQKTFPFKESKQLMLRLEAANLFNHPQFNFPGSKYLGSNFGVITSTAGQSRALQGVIKLRF